MHKALIARLKAYSGINTATGGRINWMTRPQGQGLPAIALQQISGAREYGLAYVVGTAVGRVQVDMFASTYGAAKDLAGLVRQRLEGGPFTASGQTVQTCFLIGERDLDGGQETEGVRVFRVSLDFEVRWNEETPS